MLAWVGARLAGLWGKLLFIAGFAVALLSLAASLISAGRRQERGAQAERENQAVKTRREVDDEIDRIGHADVDRRLADRWVRPD